jgi:HSP20 family molecular chaperone IbpA
VQAPKFDIFEIDGDTSGWLLIGNVPGVKSEEDIRFEWVDGTTIFIRGTLATASIPTFGETESKILKTIHKERHEGPFERSVTFPTKADPESLKVEVKNGVVYVRIFKKSGEEKKE